MYFPVFAPAVRPGTQSCKSYIQQYPMLGYKTEHKLLDIRLWLDMMSADEAMYSCTPYPISGGTQTHQQQDVCCEEFISGGTITWTSVRAIPSSPCTDDYVQWFLPRSHPRIQNPLNIPHGFYVLVDPPILPQALLDLIAREARREDARKEDKFYRITELLTRHYHAS
ncbi:hypothetical protein M9H77_32157 [Catharanthus roseus]|uniref:Uncharacterized protein n=1 Tax=Catharanthus roseus TaxID=4058 RepID=A0ACC0A230_CATRO|nr:hypothetical protein M9H77_32157 [Catharanthus roseus]